MRDLAKRWLLAAAMLSACAMPSLADYRDRRIGNWLVSATEDRFGDGGEFTAVTAADETLLAVRCLRKKLSIAVVKAGPDPPAMKKGEIFRFEFRVDRVPTDVTTGKVIAPTVVELDTDADLVIAIRDAKETAMRMIGDDWRLTVVFKTAGGAKAFADLARECPLD
jgi:hypothetical protein